MTVILHSELLTAELPCGVYYYGGVYRAWYLGAPGSLDLPSHALWSIDDSDPVTLYGEVTLFASGDTFGPVPESEVVLEFDFTPPVPGTYIGTFTTDSDADVEDSFELEGVWEVPTDHEINYFAGTGGTISGTTPQTVADGGDGTPVTAVPDPGYRFVEWAEDSSTDPERQELNVTTDLTFTAVFEAIPQYTITYTALTGGSISGDNPQTVYESEDGTPVTAVAAAPLYAFVKWVEDDNTDPERYEENVTEDKSFTALFVYLYPNGVHVKEDAAGNCDGTDWANAFNSLQEGMDFASDYGIANVLVAQGSYRPERCEDITGGPRFNTFVLHNNVRVIGGFSGIGYDRDRDAYPTILSGDMGDYNVYNVIRIPSDAGLDNTCILEDAIVSGGRAEGSPKYPQTLTGGGIFVQSGNECMFLNCVVRDNTAVLGGGIHITGYSNTMISELLGDPDPMAPLPEPSEDPEPVDDSVLPYLEGCIFTENTARLGGGIYLSGINAASPVFTACEATFNNAVYGGGLMADSCAGELCIGLDYSLTPYGQAPGLTVTYNKASMCGGGLFLYRSTMGCKYVLARSNNALKTGGGLLMSSLTGNTVQYCLFDSNSSPIGGGAAFTSGTVEVSDTLMVGNTAARTGAGVSSSGGAVLIDRCFFKANLMVDSARNDKSGGALSSLYSRMSVYNSYFTGNRANLGSVVYTDKGSVALTGVTVEGNIEDHRSACFHARGTTLAVIASVILNSNLQDGVPCGGFPGNITGQDLALSAGADTGWVTGTAITGDPETEVSILTYPWDEGYSEILVPASGSPLRGVVNITVFDGYDTDLTETLRSDPASIGAVD